MASNSTKARLRYLNDASHLLSNTSQPVSSRLMSQFNKVAFENELNLPQSRQRQVCGACGNIMIVGRTSHVFSQTSSKSQSLSKPNALKGGRLSRGPSIRSPTVMTWECNSCHRKTKQAVPRSSRVPKTALKSSPGQVNRAASGPSIGESYTPMPTEATSMNSSSKKRAKARKRNDLKSLLAKNKAGDNASSKSHNLDLMDFLQHT